MESVNSGKPVEQVIKDRGFASGQDIIKARSALLGIPFVDLSAKAILPDVLQLVPEPVARRYNVVPFELDPATDSLSVAMIDPLDINVISFLEKKLGYKIIAYISPPMELSKVVDETVYVDIGRRIIEIQLPKITKGKQEMEEV